MSVLKPSYYKGIEYQLLEIFRHLIFFPMMTELVKAFPSLHPKKWVQAKIENASDNLLKAALKSGRVQYSNGVFSGKFNATIANSLRSIGAQFDKRSKVYRIDPLKVPNWIKGEAMVFNDRVRQTNQILEKILDQTSDNLDAALTEAKLRVDPMIDRVVADFRDVAARLEVSPVLLPQSKEKLAADYNQNMKLWIKKFSEEEIIKLRSIVEENATQGFRADYLASKIEQRYSVTASKAKFLAAQETRLFVSKFRQQRFEEAGSMSYIWSTSHDERVRPAIGLTGKSRADAGNHRVLDGRKFLWSSPPIVDPATGRRAHPGEDFGCRCVAKPILPSLVK